MVGAGATSPTSPERRDRREISFDEARLIVLVVHPEDPDMRSILLLLLGVPLPIIILIALFSH